MSAPVCAFHHATTSTDLIPSQGAVVLNFFSDGRWGQRMLPGSGADLLRQHYKASNVADKAPGNVRQHFVTFVNICKTFVLS